MSEMMPEVAIEKDWCLLNLIGQAEGRQVDARADSHLIERLNESELSPEGYASAVLKCRVANCALLSLVKSEAGVLEVIDQRGKADCHKSLR